MKKLLLVGAFVLGVTAVSFAQGPGRRSPEEQVAQLKTQITGITDDQAAKLKVVYESVAKSRDSLMQAAQGGGDRQAMMANFTKMQTATDSKIKAVLNAEQAAAYQKIADERAAQMRQRMGN